MAPATMKAAICRAANEPVSIEEVPVPTPSGRQVLVRVKVASLCHSDISIISGAFGPVFPRILGHEAVSEVVELGPDAAPFGIHVGDLIGAPLWENMCLECIECRTAGVHFCPKTIIKGIHCEGYFAEYATVDAASAVVVQPAAKEGSPSSALTIHPRNLASVFCAGVTVWDALEKAEPKPGESIGVVGAGGLGQLAIKYASALGAKVFAFDVRDEQLQACKGPGGADEVINTSGLDVAALRQTIASLNGGRLIDAIIVTSGVVPAYTTGLSAVRARGRVIAVGLPHQDIPVSSFLMSGQAIHFIGAKVPDQAGAKRCLDFTMRKEISPKVHERRFKLEDLNEMLDLMRAGKVEEGRMAVEFF